MSALFPGEISVKYAGTRRLTSSVCWDISASGCLSRFFLGMLENLQWSSCLHGWLHESHPAVFAFAGDEVPVVNPVEKLSRVSTPKQKIDFKCY